MKKSTPAIAAALLVCTSQIHAAPAAKGSDSYYTGEQVYSLQPKPQNHKEMGHIGPTGILAFVEVGVKVTINPHSPALRSSHELSQRPSPKMTF